MTRPPFTLDRDAGLVVDRRALVASGVMDRQLRAAKTLYKRNQEQQMIPDQMTADDVRRIVREELARAAEQSDERMEG